MVIHIKYFYNQNFFTQHFIRLYEKPMNEQKIHEEMPNGTAGEFQSDSKQELLNETIIIKGILASRLETRQKNNQPYYYGFFKLENQVGEFPVVFKTKPNLTKGNQVELIGK